ncbi:MAG: DNA helicase Rep [Thiohalomonadales bacterium]
MINHLNSKQNEAVHYVDSPLLVLAGAGSGKTRVITTKIAYLINECGIQATKIVAVTFTNKAAREMKQRVSGQLDKKSSRGLQISTFHTLGLKIIRAEFESLGYKSGFSIYDSHDCLSIIKEICNSKNLADNDIATVQTKISAWKNDLINPRRVCLDTDADAITKYAAQIYAEYCKYLKACNAVDFDDLIYQPVTLFQNDAPLLDKWQNRIRYMLVDEYQDTNTSQYQLIKLLVGARAALTVVGDDDQSIYAWRGAQAENLVRLSDDFPGLKVIKLEQNYRSTSCILQAANVLIDNNPHVFDKKLWSEIGFGELISIVESRNEDHEAERIVTEIMAHKFQKGSSYSDYAILYRGNHQSRPLERQLREQQITYQVTGGKSFFSHAEVKDIIAYMRLVCNPDDNAAFIRIVNTPRRGIGASSLEKLMQYAEHRGVSFYDASQEMGLASSMSERQIKPLRIFSEWINRMVRRADDGELLSLITDIISSIEYEDWLLQNSNDERAAQRKMANVHELSAWIQHIVNNRDEEVDLATIVSHMQLMDILERQEQDQEQDAVNLMTLHAAKGLEFPVVYIVGVEEEILPHHSSIDAGDVEEERRLAYVGITRAQRELTLSYAMQRKRGGEMQDCDPSRFLSELPEDSVSWRRLGDKVDPVARQEKGKAQLSALRGLLSDAS